MLLHVLPLSPNAVVVNRCKLSVIFERSCDQSRQAQCRLVAIDTGRLGNVAHTPES